MAIAVFILGAVVIVALGYTYVFVVLGLRTIFLGDFRPFR
jgi:hypothetical protein